MLSIATIIITVSVVVCVIIIDTQSKAGMIYSEQG